MNNRNQSPTPAETEPHTPSTPAQTTCPEGWKWCTLDHDLEGHNDFHSGEFIDLDKSEADGCTYFAYLTANTGEQPVILISRNYYTSEAPMWATTLPLEVVEHLLQALDDGGERAMQALGGLLRDGGQEVSR